MRSCTKDFSLIVECVVTTGSLPNGTNGVAYSQTVAVSGFTGSATWSIVSGALPSGLSLNSSTGEISGTPNTVETKAFTIQALQGEISCQKALSIQIESAAIDWTQLLWNSPTQSIIGPGTTNLYVIDPAADPVQQDHFEVHSDATTQFVPAPTAIQRKDIGSLVYNGPAINCNLAASLVSIHAPDANGEANWYVRVSGDHFAQFTIGNGPSGNYPFTIPTTGGLPKNIFIEFEVNAISLVIGFTITARVHGVLS